MPFFLDPHPSGETPICSLLRKIPVFAKKQPLRKFDAKAFFEVRRGVSDVVCREESEFEVKIAPKQLKNIEFSKFRKILNFEIS